MNNRKSVTAARSWCFVGLMAFLLFSSYMNKSYSSDIASPQMHEDEICKYVIPSPAGTLVDANSPVFFQDIKSIYIFSSLGLGAKNSFSRSNVSNLAACVLRRHLDNYGSPTKQKLSIPVQVVEKGDGQPESVMPGSLVINVVLNVSDKLWLEEQASQKMVNVQFLHFRADQPILAQLPHQCAISFPFTDDIEKRTQLMTYATQRCLSKWYSVTNPKFEKK